MTNKRTITIGDIHGGKRALIQLLERVQPTEKDHLIFLGDYVDGWSESAQLIDYLIDLGQKIHCTFIFGNHDAWCLDWLSKEEVNPYWLKHGGQATLDSYSGYSDDQKLEHEEFFRNTENFLIDDARRLFIHAGFTSLHGPEREHYQSNYGWDRTLWEMAVALHGRLDKNEAQYPKRLLMFESIYIGHTPTPEYGSTLPLQKANVWNLDTGAAFKGPLSAMDIESNQIWQSDPVHLLYPGEAGRNLIT